MIKFQRSKYKKTVEETSIEFSKRIIFSVYGEDQYADNFSQNKGKKMSEILATKNQIEITDLGIFDLMDDIRGNRV